MQPGFFYCNRDGSFLLLTRKQGALGRSKIAAKYEKDRPFFIDRIFCRPVKGTARASGEGVKIVRRMPGVSRTGRLVKILLEIVSAGVEDAQPKISCVG